MPDVVVTTAAVAPSDREAYWHHVLADMFAPVALEGWTDAPDPGARLTGTRRGPVLLADLAATPHIHRRLTSQIHAADAAFCQVAVLTSGAARLDQDGRTAELGPGDLVVYENSRPFTWTFTRPWRACVLSIPSDTVRLSTRERTTMSARRLSGSDGLSGVVARFVRDATRHASDTSARDADNLLGQAADLAVTLLASESNSELPDARHRNTMTLVKDFIATHLRDPALTPEAIANEAHISTRQLHKLFEGEHHTVALYVRDLRLRLAHRELIDPANVSLSVATLAHRCGFGDISGFGRAFKAAYGVTPGEVHRPHVNGGHEPRAH